jgi:1-acyl-sn-glycerol-3-phosphate acyltransferase
VGALRGVVAAVSFVTWTLLLLPVQVVAMQAFLRMARRVPRVYHRGVRVLLGFKVEVSGRASVDRPTLIVANHASWADIVVLGSLVEGTFVAKDDVGNWPGIGYLARLQQTVFIDRDRRRAGDHRDAISRRLADGECLIIFPEGTSNDGARVLPFKSALFAVAESGDGPAPLQVQPVTIAYRRIGGRPADAETLPRIAWYGEMTLVPHVWGVLGLGSVDVEVTFHDPVSPAAFASRKSLAAHCHHVVATRLAGSAPLASEGSGVATEAVAGVPATAPLP